MARKSESGGSAFPTCVSADDGGEPGMSLRDYFASLAMQGLVMSSDEGAGDRIEDVPKYAYQIADAMLRERENRPTI